MLAVGDNAFGNCTALREVFLPDTLTSIGQFAFSGCSNLLSIDLSGCTGMLSLGEGVFQNCVRLESVTLPENLTSFGSTPAFLGCTSLQSISFPASFSSLAYSFVFQDFNNLTVYLNKADAIVTVDSAAFYNAANITVYVPSHLLAAYEADLEWQNWTQTVGNVTLVSSNAAVNIAQCIVRSPLFERYNGSSNMRAISALY